MINEIQDLFNDLDLFAKLVAEHRLSNYSFDVLEFRLGYMEVDLFIVDKKISPSHQSAFSALFKKKLFTWEEWDKSQEYDSSDSEWVNALKEHWIPEYFLNHYSLNIKTLDLNDFRKTFKDDLHSLKVSEDDIDYFLKKFTNLTVIQIIKQSSYEMIFGMTDDIYLLYEFGIYD